jgi:hypothetical protein
VIVSSGTSPKRSRWPVAVGATVVQRRVFLRVDEELRGRAVHDPGAGHGDRTDLVREAVAGLVLDRVAHRFLLHRGIETAALDHEALDHTMEDRSVVVLVVDVLQEVFDRDGSLFGVEFDDELTQAGRHDDDRFIHGLCTFFFRKGQPGCANQRQASNPHPTCHLSRTSVTDQGTISV